MRCHRLYELIDTLWNVNKELEQILGKWKPELIDTLWNVNSDKWTEQELQKLGINRYIMECKFISISGKSKGSFAN